MTEQTHDTANLYHCNISSAFAGLLGGIFLTVTAYLASAATISIWLFIVQIILLVGPPSIVSGVLLIGSFASAICSIGFVLAKSPDITAAAFSEKKQKQLGIVGDSCARRASRGIFFVTCFAFPAASFVFFNIYHVFFPHALNQVTSKQVTRNGEMIRFYGPVDMNTAEQLRIHLLEIFKNNEKPNIEIDLHSPGGEVYAMTLIVNMLNIVAENGTLKTKVSPGNACASACVPMFLSGMTREAAPDAAFLIHDADHYIPAFAPVTTETLGALGRPLARLGNHFDPVMRRYLIKHDDLYDFLVREKVLGNSWNVDRKDCWLTGAQISAIFPDVLSLTYPVDSGYVAPKGCQTYTLMPMRPLYGKGVWNR